MPKPVPVPSQIAKHPGKLRLAAMLAEGAMLSMGWDDIAAEIGVDRRSIYTWRKEPGFGDYVLALQREEIRDALPVAYATLIKEMKCGGKDKIRAAELILKAGGELIERVENTNIDATAMMQQAREHIAEAVELKRVG